MVLAVSPDSESLDCFIKGRHKGKERGEGGGGVGRRRRKGRKRERRKGAEAEEGQKEAKGRRGGADHASRLHSLVPQSPSTSLVEPLLGPCQ